ncbi:Frizzled-10-A [Schistosoma japonicum]|uniref:Frizzled-10-A n=1 Tax=Schistosoma japonicum TaxID=6182 RepID=A0A4Z2DZ63_SCHJA|nr:Frizzled-10-A [Schistosoma japonicum]
MKIVRMSLFKKFNLVNFINIITVMLTQCLSDTTCAVYKIRSSNFHFYDQIDKDVNFSGKYLPRLRTLRDVIPLMFPINSKEIEVPDHLKNLIEVNQNGNLPNQVYPDESPGEQQGEIENGIDDVNHCIPIHEPICHGLQYTHTWLPNSVGLTTQEEAAKRMNDYRSLINVGCSHYLKFFLCTVYFPMCTPTLNPPAALQPCQNLCRYVQSKCEPIMKSFSFPWPIELNCKALPSDSGMCIQPQNYDLDKQGQIISPGIPSEARGAIANLLPNFSEFLAQQSAQNQLLASTQNNQTDNTNEKILSVNDNQSGLTRHHVIHRTKLQSSKCYVVEILLYSEQAHNNITCARRCNAHLFYKPVEKRFANIWMLVWSIICLGSCALTIITFTLNRTRFAYPERPIIYISVCCFVYSAGFILHSLIGRDLVACRNKVETISPSLLTNGVSQVGTKKLFTGLTQLKVNASFLITSGYEGTWCTIIFIILFYFSQASYLWWVMLAISWFLSASCKWGCEGIEAVSSIFHMLAWALPALKTIIILIMHRIDADELTGLCNVGYQNSTSLLTFILLPQIIYLLLGIMFLLVGFHSLISLRSNLKQHAKSLLPATKTTTTPANCYNSQCKRNASATVAIPTMTLQTMTTSSPVIALNNGNIRRLDKLMIKIGIFSMLYIIPCACVIGVNIYNYINYPEWMKTLDRLSKQTNCLTEYGTSWSLVTQCLEDNHFPSAEANMLQIFMSLVVGITSGMWVWCNRKSSETWLKCIKRRKKNLSQHSLNYRYHICGDVVAGDTVGETNNVSQVDQKAQLMNTTCCNSRAACGKNNQYPGNTMNFDNTMNNINQLVADSTQYHQQQHQNEISRNNVRNLMLSGSFNMSSGTASCTSAPPLSHGLGTINMSLLNSFESNYCTRSSQRQTFKTRPSNTGRPDC